MDLKEAKALLAACRTEFTIRIGDSNVTPRIGDRCDGGDGTAPRSDSKGANA